MDHEIVASHQLVDQTGITNVASDEPEAILGQAFQRFPIPGVGQLVQHRDRRICAIEDIPDEVRADETRPAGHQKFRHASHPMDS
jgi:hypothetical protein